MSGFIHIVKVLICTIYYLRVRNSGEPCFEPDTAAMAACLLDMPPLPLPSRRSTLCLDRRYAAALALALPLALLIMILPLVVNIRI